MTKQRKAVHGMNPEQLAALNKWAGDMRKAAPMMKETAAAARKISEEMIAAPVWRMAEGSAPGGAPRPAEQPAWNIGAPKVNYVDHIDRIGDSAESPDDEGKQS